MLRTLGEAAFRASGAYSIAEKRLSNKKNFSEEWTEGICAELLLLLSENINWFESVLSRTCGLYYLLIREDIERNSKFVNLYFLKYLKIDTLYGTIQEPDSPF